MITRTIHLFVLASLLLTGCNEKQPETKSTQPVSSQASQTDSLNSVKFATPDECLAAYYSAVRDNDATAYDAASAFLTNAYRDAFFDANVATDAAFKQLNASLKKQFGESAKTLPVPNETLMEKLKTIPIENISEVTATWPHGGKKSLDLVKLNGGWKVELRTMEKMSPGLQLFESLQNVARQLTEIADDIDQGKITNQAGVRNAISNLK